ncbi:hypothetical protein LINPERPRIM_LOCUS15757 [Linum perenne]
MRSTLSNRYGLWIIRQLNNGHTDKTETNQCLRPLWRLCRCSSV